jgi:hypothetical protein
VTLERDSCGLFRPGDSVTSVTPLWGVSRLSRVRMGAPGHLSRSGTLFGGQKCRARLRLRPEPGVDAIRAPAVGAEAAIAQPWSVLDRRNVAHR